MPLEAQTYLVLPHPMAEIQKDLVAIDLVFVGWVIVKAVPFESLVLELNKTQTRHLGLDFYTPSDFSGETPETTPGK